MKKISILTPSSASQPLVDDPLLNSDNNNSSTIISNTSTPATKAPSMKSSNKKRVIIFSIIAIFAGVLTGYGVNAYSTSSTSPLTSSSSEEDLQQVAGDSVKNGDVYGSTDESFDNEAEGYLEEGGLDGEGSHKLLRPGGVSQTVYLTSSVTDLDKFVGMQVKVLGETFKGQKAGWLMDVGQVQVINTQGEAPEE